ncbi:MAG: hypothetical protein C0615_12155 [Desulfuromonas sp.]|nr:MAG: hypothetical protein C0615_12155 [Desulfuromonas sp.]
MRLIEGFREVTVRIGDYRVSAVAPDVTLPDTDIVVTETDTFMVLQDENHFTETTEPPLKILTKAFHATPVSVGSVIPGGTDPLRLHAVIYDFDQEEICRPEWLARAWRQIVDIVNRSEYKLLTTPLLGGKSHQITIRERCQLFHDVLEEAEAKHHIGINLLCNGPERREWSTLAGNDKQR